MKFGNWSVEDKGIAWDGGGFNRFVIDRDSLLDTDSSNGMYKAIIKATEEDWLAEDDLYDLNFAFVFAAGKMGIDFSYEVFDKTVAYQYDLLDDEENSQPDLNQISPNDAEAEQRRKEALSERD